ncbi:MAG: hypothetical protein MJE77_14355 [Proteobacteria bacterium]|nr:hypothetical protein [Pseudomonadota bacterium]
MVEKNRIVLIWIVAFPVVAFAWFLLGESQGSEEVTVTSAQVVETTSNKLAALTPDLRRLDRRPMPGHDETTQREAFRKKLSRAYNEYVEFSKYPPWSRPADGSQYHLIAWNRPVSHSQVISKTKDGREIHAEARIAQMFWGPGEKLVARVEAWVIGQQGTREEVDFSARAEVRIWDETELANGRRHRTRKVGPTVSFASQVGAKARFKFGTIVPTEIPELSRKVEQAELVVYVSAGAHTKPFELPFEYAAKSPFEVLAKRADRIVAGSLEVELEVRADHAAPVLIQATLFAKNGNVPVAIFDGFVRPKLSGRQVATITFFGRAINDVGEDGPYMIRAIHGRASNAKGETYWRCDQEFSTSAYKASDFSDAEWWSEERSAKLSQYEELMNDNTLRTP